VFVNVYSGLTTRESVSDFTKKSGIMTWQRSFQIQFLAGRTGGHGGPPLQL